MIHPHRVTIHLLNKIISEVVPAANDNVAIELVKKSHNITNYLTASATKLKA